MPLRHLASNEWVESLSLSNCLLGKWSPNCWWSSQTFTVRLSLHGDGAVVRLGATHQRA